MQIRMLGVMCLGLLAACGPAGEDVSSVESAVFSANDSSHARELIVHCSNDVWTVLVRATKEVRAVEVVTNLNGSYATLDGPLKAPYQDDINGWAFVQPVHVSADEAELARLSREGVAVTSTACDAGTLDLRISLKSDSWTELECVTLGTPLNGSGCVDFEPFVTSRH